MIVLYEFPLSGNCHKVRLMLGLLGLNYQSIVVDGGQQAHKSTEFLTLNPFGQVPVLKDGHAIIRDSQAILIYLAKQYGGLQWWPENTTEIAHIAAWLSTVANEVAHGPNALRLHYKFGRSINMTDAQQVTERLLNLLEVHFSSHEWIARDVPSIADIALYPYIALASEGQVDLSVFPSIRTWLQHIQALPGYVDMPGMWHLNQQH
jgi:glutathione S-transferase